MSGLVTILDGGMGHELKLRGISDGSFLAGVLANENCTTENAVESIHRNYLAAGCDVITTNSFVAVPQRMRECGLADDDAGAKRRASELIRSSVDRARDAIAIHEKRSVDSMQKHKIAGCVPPLTECYFAKKVPSSLNDLIPEYTVILSTLLNCNVDILLSETLSTTREALAILRSLSGLQKIGTHHIPPLWISFTVHDDRPAELRSDELLEAACKMTIRESISLDLPLEAIGINCSTPTAISNAIPILAKLVEGTNIRVSAYGNCFRTTTTEWMNSLGNESEGSNFTASVTEHKQNCVGDYDEEGYLLPNAYAKCVIPWVKSGATIIGGCCGSRPEHMEKVASLLKHLQ